MGRETKYLKRHLKYDYRKWREQLKYELGCKEQIKKAKKCKHKWKDASYYSPSDGAVSWEGGLFEEANCSKCGIYDEKDNSRSASLGGLKGWEKENKRRIIKLTSLIKTFELL